MLLPPLRHWNVGEGVPDPLTVKVTGVPSQTSWPAGLVSTVGAVLTVSEAPVLVTPPQALETMQSYEPALPGEAKAVYVAAVAPGMFTVSFRHWKLVAPVAATVNEKLWPTHAVVGEG